jgi:hypothetical protein
MAMGWAGYSLLWPCVGLTTGQSALGLGCSLALRAELAVLCTLLGLC